MDPINALLVALANILLGATDATPCRNASEARTILRTVFTGRNSTQKIAAIKFIRTYTDMGLKESKELVEREIFNGAVRVLSIETVRAMQERGGMRDSERI